MNAETRRVRQRPQRQSTGRLGHFFWNREDFATSTRAALHPTRSHHGPYRPG